MKKNNNKIKNEKNKKLKAVILAAGKSKRTYPLTITRPKPLLKVANKIIIEHNLTQLSGLVDEALIVVGYKNEMIINYLGNKFKDINLKYIIQEEQLGTGHALLMAKDFISDKFIVMSGDDLFSKNDILNLINEKNAVLVYPKENPKDFGVFIVENNKPIKIIEKPQDFEIGLCNTSCYIFDQNIFSLLKKLKLSPRGEYELTDAVLELIENDNFNLVQVKDYWIPISYPWDLLNANSHFLKEIKQDIKGTVEKNVKIDGNIILGKNSIILPGVYIEGNVIIGNNCKIGPNSYIRGPTTIGNNCRIGPCELKASVIFDNCRIDHVSYIGDSVLGEYAHIGAHTVIANLRHDKKNHKSIVNNLLIDTNRRKLGIIMGDNTHAGINTSFYPGRKMWPNTFTYPTEVVKEDIIDRKI
jgi:UDP-N-acetylglucosamine diphosphorylase / glucose-1-phosphate thymidylyltransferase / UDP-N-acetylgalactosamine diphosphorylase / glucosamine-1-phosphate N-acetyltransferase / galactosamine-1-phosphate N-acetyltransferase